MPIPLGTPRRRMRSTPGRIAAAITSPSRKSETRTRSCQRASVSATIVTTTSVAIAVLRAVSPIARVFWPGDESRKPVLPGPDEPIRLDARRHGVVLARPLLRSALLAALAAGAFLLGWPATVGGALLLLASALLALRAVWRWDRTRLVVTDERLVVVHGIVR